MEYIIPSYHMAEEKEFQLVSNDVRPVRRGARFSMGINRAADIHDFLNSDTTIARKYHALLKALTRLCSKDPERKTDAHNLAKSAELTLPTIHVYADHLVTLGLFTKQQLRATKGRPPSLYTMLSIDAFLQRKASFEPAEIGEGMQDAELALPVCNDVPDFELEALNNDLAILPSRPGLYRAELFSTYTLLSVLRLGKSGGRTHGSYVSDVYVGPARMRIKVSSQTGYAIAGIMDTKALIGLCTFAKTYYSEPANQGRPLVIDLSDFTSFLRLSPSGGNKRHVWKMIRAWEKTGFQVLAADDAIRKFYGPKYFTLDEFRFITRIKTLINGKTPERIALTLEKGLLDRILDSESRFLSAIHTELMRETSAARMLFYFWCRRAVQYRATPNFWNLRHLRREMAPYMTPSDFTAMLKKITAKSHNLDGSLKPLHGYFIKSIYNENNYLDGFEIWANKSDRLIKSYYQRNPPILENHT